MRPLDRHLWAQLSPMLDEVLDLAPDDRVDYVTRLEASSPALAERLVALLKAHDEVSTSGFLAEHPEVVDGLRAGLAGRTIGAYTLDRRLGQGGMGSVWLAHRSDGRYAGQVALKLVHQAVYDAKARERFAREGNILARLAHPNIARLLDAGVTPGGQPYLVLEYIEGVPIDRFADEQRLDVPARLRLFVQVAHAVAHAHEHLVVHRDLKPSNILVCADGTVKLLDFGIATLLSDEDAAGATAEATHGTAMVLTPKYAAPEQVNGAPISTATDVYALGVLLYLLLTGRHPTAPDASSAVDYLRAAGRPPERLAAALARLQAAPAEGIRIAAARQSTLDRLARGFRRDLDTVLGVALRPDPGERYRSVAQFADDVRRYLRHEPVSVEPDSWWYRTRMLVARRRLESAAVVVATLGLVAGLGVAVWQARVAQQQRDRALLAESESSAINRFLVRELLTAATPERAQGQPLSVTDVLDNAARTVGYAFADQPYLEGTVRATLASSYLAIGAMPKAREHAAAARSALEQATAAHPLEALRGRALTARLALEDGRYDEARSEIDAVVAAQEALVGPGHVDPLSTRVLLVRTLIRLHDYRRAEATVRAALAHADRLPSSDWRIVADLQTELANVLVAYNRGLEAEPVVQALLEVQQQRMGPLHPDVLRTMALQASVLTTLLRYDAALEIRREIVTRREQIHGRDHPQTALALYDLVISLDRLGREAETLALLQRAHDIYARALGPEHASTVTTLRAIGVMHGRARDGFAAAEPIYRQVLDIRQRTLGDLHFSTLEAAGALLSLYARFGHDAEARRAGRDVQRRCDALFARANTDSVSLTECSRFYATAEPADLRDLSRAVAFGERAVAADGRRGYDPLMALARAHEANGDDDRALSTFRDALALPQALQSFTLERDIVRLMEKRGDTAALERWLLDRLVHLRDERGPDEPLQFHTLRHLAALYQRQGRQQDAEARRREQLAVVRKSYPERHWQVALSKSELGESLAARKAFADAERLELEAVRDLEADRFVSRAMLAGARARLVALYTAWGRPADAAKWQAGGVTP